MGVEVWLVAFCDSLRNHVCEFLFESVQTQSAREGGLNRRESVPTAPTALRLIESFTEQKFPFENIYVAS